MNDHLADLAFEFRRHKLLADRAMENLDDGAFFQRPAEKVNSVALIVKHLAGNLASRWTNFLSTDGDKPGRDRDAEFIQSEQDTRANLAASWEKGWGALFDALVKLTPADLGRTVTIRGEEHTVLQALLRGATHAAYHTGQILYLARLLRPDGAWLTVAPGQSRDTPGNYRKMPLGIRDFKVYMPAKDFEKSKRFYTALGFKMSEGWGGTADFELDGNRFRLQDYYVKDWAENFMVVMGVEDAEAWHQHARNITASGEFGPIRIQPPETVDGARVLHVVDPSGVLLIFVQRATLES